MSQLTAVSKDFPSMTTQLGYCAAAALNGKLCAVGGCGGGGGDSIEICDIVNGGRWTQAPSKMNQRRYGCAAAANGNSVYVAGGWHQQSVEAFDVETGLWRTLPSMSTKRDGCAAVAVGDEFFVFGGRDGSRRTLNTAESFNVKTGRWEDLPPMNNRRRFCAAAVISNKIYVVGGYDRETLSTLDTVNVFDLTTRTWTLLQHRMISKRQSSAAAAVGNYLVVAGGHDGSSKLNTVEVYDINSEMWVELPPMSVERCGCAAVSLGGSIFVIGGQDNNSRYLDSVEEIPFSDNVIKGMLVEWSEGSWSKDVLPLLHWRTSVIHKLDIDITSMPTILSRVGEESKVQTVYEILRGEMGVFERTGDQISERETTKLRLDVLP